MLNQGVFGIGVNGLAIKDMSQRYFSSFVANLGFYHQQRKNHSMTKY